MTPPRLGKGVGNEMLKLAGLGLKIRGLGRDDLREFMRLMLINVADVLDDELMDDRLKGVIAFDTVLGAHLGPRSPNSLLLLFNRLAGEALSIPKGGMGSVAAAMAKAVQALGVEIRLNARVQSVTIADDKATGVTLKNGESLQPKQSSLPSTPKQPSSISWARATSIRAWSAAPAISRCAAMP